MISANQIRQQKCNLFVTRDSLDTVINTYNLQGGDVAVLMIAVNTALEQLAKQAEANSLEYVEKL